MSRDLKQSKEDWHNREAFHECVAKYPQNAAIDINTFAKDFLNWQNKG